MKDAFIEDDEILEMAVAREVDAIKFYTVLAESARDSNMRRMFEELAAEEMEHKAKLELEIMKTGRVVDTQRRPTGFNDDKAGYVPPEVDIDYKGILSIGLQKEDASFRLYMDLAGMINDPRSRDMLVALAQEEAEHKLRFQTELERIAESE
ncbi:MAG: ferritin family protein [Sedimentisphaerales bacterium]